MNSSRILTLSFFVIAAGCGRPDYLYDGPGNYDADQGEAIFPGAPATGTTSQVPAHTVRKDFCLFYTAPETDAEARAVVLSALDGTWKRERKPKSNVDFRPFGEKFSFRKSDSFSSLSAAFLAPEEKITAKRICVGKPRAKADEYQGFRIVEFVAENNEGIAAFAMRFGRPYWNHEYSTLFLTARTYRRFGQNDPLESEDALFAAHLDGEKSVRIWVYPTRE